MKEDEYWKDEDIDLVPEDHARLTITEDAVKVGSRTVL
jgi:hypothetical protein